MKLNLGCGRDIRDGYENVDAFVNDTRIINVDLSKFPWPWADSTADEVLMLDFLEHFPYSETSKILGEAWRVLKVGSYLHVQVPSFEECAKAMLWKNGTLCNKCGTVFGDDQDHSFPTGRYDICVKCGSTLRDVAEAAMKRLYGGQDFEGNFHHTAFTRHSLHDSLYSAGFIDFESLETEHQRLNWNYKVRAKKSNVIRSVWGDEP